ncbi:MAG: ferric enterobactin receptor, partial [Bacteroidota bacterium]
PQIIIDANNDGDATNDQSVLDATQEALLFTSRPKFKAILGIDYTIKKFTFSLNNTVFGPTKFRNAGMDENLQIEFETKLVTDFGLHFQASDAVGITLNVNNIFNVLPKWKFVALNDAGRALMADTSENGFGLTPIENQSNLITFNQRYSTMTYDGYHFSQLGTLLNLAVSVKF